MVFMLYIFGWNDFRFGYASAVAVVLFVILAALTFLQFRLQGRWVHYEYD
jgi:multiple sugar transport system permease protein